MNIEMVCVDQKGFFYARYPAAEITDQGTETDANKLQKVYYHKLGDDQEKDQLIFYEPSMIAEIQN